MADTRPTKSERRDIYFSACKQTRVSKSWLWCGDTGLLVSHNERNKQVLVFTCVWSFIPTCETHYLSNVLWFRKNVRQPLRDIIYYITLACSATQHRKTETSQLTSSRLACFLSTSAIFLFLFSYCPLILLPFQQISSLCSAVKTNKTKKHVILSFNEKSSLCQHIHLLQHRVEMIQHNVVCLPLCNSLGYLCSFNFGSCHSEYQSPL